MASAPTIISTRTIWDYSDKSVLPVLDNQWGAVTMREISTAVAFSVVLTLILYAILSPILPGDAAQLATGVIAMGPIFAEYIKRKDAARRLQINPVGIFRAASLSWYAAAAYGVLLAVGVPNLVGGIASFFEFVSLRSLGVTDNIVLGQAGAAAAIVPVTSTYFLMGRLFARCDRRRWAAVAITVVLGPILLRLIDFLVIPQSYFDSAFPLQTRSLHDFVIALAWTIGMLLIFLGAGTLWFGRRHYRVKVSAMMRLLPIETQHAIAELVRDEVEGGRILTTPRVTEPGSAALHRPGGRLG